MTNKQLARQGLSLVWNHKVLWVLGFLAGLLNFATQALMASAAQEPAGAGAAPIEPPPPLTAAEAVMVVVVLGSVAVVLVLLWLVDIAANGGLYYAVSELDEDRPAGLWAALLTGIRCLPRLVAVTVLLYLPLGLLPILALSLGVMVEMSVTGGSDLVLLAVAGLALLYLAVMLPILPFVQMAIVLERRGVVAAIRYGIVILMTKLWAVIGLGPWVFIYCLPALLLVGVVTAVNSLAGSILAVLMGAVVAAFQSAAFTLRFRQWQGHTAAALPEEVHLALA